MKKVREGVWRFSDWLPAVEEGCKQTLGAGDTPLRRLRHSNIWIKVDFINPTGSFKDRGMAFLISKIVEEDVDRVIIDSSGTAAGTTAAYCSGAGVGHIAGLPEYSHMEKKIQVLWHGSLVIVEVSGDGSEPFPVDVFLGFCEPVAQFLDVPVGYPEHVRSKRVYKVTSLL